MISKHKIVIAFLHIGKCAYIVKLVIKLFMMHIKPPTNITMLIFVSINDNLVQMNSNLLKNKINRTKIMHGIRTINLFEKKLYYNYISTAESWNINYLTEEIKLYAYNICIHVEYYYYLIVHVYFICKTVKSKSVKLCVNTLRVATHMRTYVSLLPVFFFFKTII